MRSRFVLRPPAAQGCLPWEELSFVVCRVVRVQLPKAALKSKSYTRSLGESSRETPSIALSVGSPKVSSSHRLHLWVRV